MESIRVYRARRKPVSDEDGVYRARRKPVSDEDGVYRARRKPVSSLVWSPSTTRWVARGSAERRSQAGSEHAGNLRGL